MNGDRHALAGASNSPAKEGVLWWGKAERKFERPAHAGQGYSEPAKSVEPAAQSVWVARVSRAKKKRSLAPFAGSEAILEINSFNSVA